MRKVAAESARRRPTANARGPAGSGNSDHIRSRNSDRLKRPPSAYTLAARNSEGGDDRHAQTARNPGSAASQPCSRWPGSQARRRLLGSVRRLEREAAVTHIDTAQERERRGFGRSCVSRVPGRVFSTRLRAGRRPPSEWHAEASALLRLAAELLPLGAGDDRAR